MVNDRTGWRRRDTVIYAASIVVFCAFMLALAFWPEPQVRRSPSDGPVLRGRFPEEAPLELPDGGIIIEEQD